MGLKGKDRSAKIEWQTGWAEWPKSASMAYEPMNLLQLRQLFINIQLKASARHLQHRESHRKSYQWLSTYLM